MATTRMTTAKAIDIALKYVPADEKEAIDKLTHIKEQATKKSNAPRKPSKAQIANDGIRESIMAFLRESNEPQRISDICAAIPALNGASSQKVSGLMRTLVLNLQVEKFVDKRITYFKVKEGV